MTAKHWVMSTFLAIRLQQNPNHYRLEGNEGKTLDERVECLCDRDIELLRKTNLVVGENNLRPTEFGDAMARYYVHFETMRNFMEMPPKAKVSEIVGSLDNFALNVIN
jgi:ATP-dependent DNA helicase HFM1/MER3